MAKVCILFFISLIACGKSVPPAVCFSPFNWQDCGRPPVHVLYYYKPGSRCEVGIWRGCPNQNMFKDEYECVNTCIFVERANPDDFHVMANEVAFEDIGLPTFGPEESENVTDVSQYENTESVVENATETTELTTEPITQGENSTTTESPTTIVTTTIVTTTTTPQSTTITTTTLAKEEDKSNEKK